VDIHVYITIGFNTMLQQKLPHEQSFMKPKNI